LNDWQSLRNKTEQLKSFSNEKFHEYLDGVLPIFDEFIETYKGNINHKFWIKVCNIKRDTIPDIDSCSMPRLSIFSCARKPVEHLTGWVVRLFGLKELTLESVSDSKLPIIQTPVELIDPIKGMTSQCHIIGGFHGIYSFENRYKPVMSLSVIDTGKVEICNKDQERNQKARF
jgi:hypothetical protein